MAMIVVRPTRHTHGFLERYDTFTLSSFPETLHPALDYCGSHSGRDGDKAKAAGITPVAARKVKAPAFAEADLVVECRKIYFDDLEPRQFLADWIEANYPNKDYHRMYFGEILAIAGVAKYRAKD
jgi:flavin reductase (DIM6/NTAB) family NADH-FMN oxidoreductase RutF